MGFEIKKLPKSQLEIKIKVLASEFQRFIDRTISQLGQNLEIEGFRRGKVPKEVIEQKIGQNKILKEAAQLAIKENYFKVISKNEIEAIANPEVEILSPPKMGGEFSFKVKISVLPEIVLPDYKKIAAICQKRKVSVEEKEIEDTLSWLKRSKAKFSQVERPAQKGDFVEIEFSSPEIEGNIKQKDAFLLGQGHLIPGFEEKLEGMKTGEEKKFSLEFPKEHFQKKLAGSKINLEVKLTSVQKVEIPELNDQFARSLGQFENLAALERSIYQGLNVEKEIQEKQRLRQEILKKIIEEVSWEIPQVLITAEQNRMLDNFKNEIANKSRISFKEYLDKINQTEETIKKSFQEEAENRIKGYLILNKIAVTENIQASEEETKDMLNKVLNKYPSIKEAEKELVRQNPALSKEKAGLGGLDLEKLKLYIESEIRNEKTLQILEGLAKL